MLTDHLAGPIPGGSSPDALIFTAPEGGPVRHGLFYARVFKPALKGNPDPDPKKHRAPALPKPYHGLRWHDLRHTCAALSLAVSPNLAMVQARLGHEDIRTTINVYGHLLPSVEEALSEGLTATFKGAQGQSKGKQVTPLRVLPAKNRNRSVLGSGGPWMAPQASAGCGSPRAFAVNSSTR
jgi:hypothetical protein